MEDKGVKGGCFIFMVVVALLAAGAVISVVMNGKSMKPKARQLVSSRNARTLDKIRGEFVSDVTATQRERFEKAYGAMVAIIEKPTDTHGGDPVEEVAAALEEIRSDGKITAVEAVEWAGLVETKLEGKMALPEKGDSP